jgi:hypothetical protein
MLIDPWSRSPSVLTPKEIQGPALTGSSVPLQSGLQWDAPPRRSSLPHFDVVTSEGSSMVEVSARHFPSYETSGSVLRIKPNISVELCCEKASSKSPTALPAKHALKRLNLCEQLVLFHGAVGDEACWSAIVEVFSLHRGGVGCNIFPWEAAHAPGCWRTSALVSKTFLPLRAATSGTCRVWWMGSANLHPGLSTGAMGSALELVALSSLL